MSSIKSGTRNKQDSKEHKQNSSDSTGKPADKGSLSAPIVLIETLPAGQHKLGVLTLNAEKTLNSLTLEMVSILFARLKAWQKDDDIAMVILQGAGEKAFCAGGDIQALYRSAINPVDGICVEAEQFFFQEYQLDYLIHTYDKPILCLGDGIVMGGGLGLMAGASHRVVTETSRIAMPEVTIGLFPDVGSTVFLNRLPYNLGYFFGITGATMNARDALFCHLADVGISRKVIPELIQQLQTLSWQSEPELNHQLLTDQLRLYTAESKHFPEANITHNLGTLEKTCRHNSLSRMLEAIANFDDDNPWLKKAKATLSAGSPLSALIIYEQLKRHQHIDLQGAFISEYTLACNMVKHPDFAEGIRALLIDKDKNPKWVYQHISHVPCSLVESLFAPRWETHPLSTVFEQLDAS
jgi:enoyl-CoA hydratase/carnithine racemase